MIDQLERHDSLYAQLYKDVEPLVKTKRVGIIGFGAVQYVPFAALRNERGFLGEEKTFFYLPSASALALMREPVKSAPSRMLVLSAGRVAGQSLILFATQAAAAVAKQYGVAAVLDSAATKETLRSRFCEASILYITAHCELTPGAPLFSRMHLAPDKR